MIHHQPDGAFRFLFVFGQIVLMDVNFLAGEAPWEDSIAVLPLNHMNAIRVWALLTLRRKVVVG